ncbi:MAG: hypothetical protein ACLTC4_08405 [Hungatella hathewayi]|uniref:Uncharacterized protein n=1 Tax=Hungatella hathewayi WAL-18680 TaxID=742737 RepID=G5II22_9FIRM|nr:hypothetical protein [Hungatella hathewayi]EHI58838.1 hypothetical protein HMPREF9473_03150 [ [Hungatella hathewayi WAL-18680]MBS4985978.1 hypothetical protein [Hungatella hathewayi]
MRWNKLHIIGVIYVMAMLLTGCANGKGSGDSILPFTSIVPGMSIEEIRKLEPELEEEEGGYALTKDYQGFPMETYLLPEKTESMIVWNCNDDELDLDKLVESLTNYFDERYEVYTTVEDDDYTAVDWRTETYDILLADTSFSFMGMETREVTVYLSLRLDLEDSTE